MLLGVYGDALRVKILYNKKDSALIQMADANQAQLGKMLCLYRICVELQQFKLLGCKINQESKSTWLFLLSEFSCETVILFLFPYQQWVISTVRRFTEKSSGWPCRSTKLYSYRGKDWMTRASQKTLRTLLYIASKSPARRISRTSSLPPRRSICLTSRE